MHNEPVGIRERIDDLLQSYPADDAVDLRFGEYSVRILCNGADLAARLSDYYRRFAVRDATEPVLNYVLDAPPPRYGFTFQEEFPSPGKTRVKNEFRDLPGGRIVRKRATDMHFLFGGGLHCAVGPCLQNLNEVVNFINTRYVERLLDERALLCHASGIAYEGQGLGIAGPSGMGKSTLALHLVSAGADFVSNDRLVLKEQEGRCRMHGVPKYPRINPGTILTNPNLNRILTAPERQSLTDLPAEELWSLERKYDARIDELFGPERFRLSAPMTGLVFLRWKRSSAAVRTEIVDLRRNPDLLISVLKPAGVFHLSPPSETSTSRTPNDLTKMLDECRVIVLEGGGDFQPAVAACLELLRSNG